MSLGIRQQLATALYDAPLSNVRHSRKSLMILLAYLLVGAGVCFIFATWLISYEDTFRQALLNYFFPESWHYLSEKIIAFFFESQQKIVVVSMITGGSLVFSSVLLFPIKEYCSRAYEQARCPENGEVRELSLMVQAKEESKLLFLYITAQAVILALGYYPYDFTRWLSASLSIVFLCFTFSLDFISLTLQRHGFRYSLIIKLLAKNPWLSLCFGACFAIPTLLLGKWVVTIEALTLVELVITLFFANLIFLGLAISGGTVAASRLLPHIARLAPVSNRTRTLAYGLVSSLFLISMIFHTSLITSAHHKSQVLKCHYDIDWESAELSLPNLGGFFKEKKHIASRFDLLIHNPTSFDLELEDTQVLFKQAGRLVGEFTISALRAPAGKSVTQHVNLAMDLNAKSLSSFKGLLSGWEVYIQYELVFGIPIIIKVI